VYIRVANTVLSVDARRHLIIYYQFANFIFPLMAHFPDIFAHPCFTGRGMAYLNEI